MEKVERLLKEKPKVINMGLKSFYESLKEQKVDTVHINWKPPAGGKRDLMEILSKIN